MISNIFVYGTLMYGFHNHDLLEGAHFLCSATTRGVLFEVSGYPGFKQTNSDDQRVHGEIYRIYQRSILEELDMLEGFYNHKNPHNLYNRIKLDNYQIIGWDHRIPISYLDDPLYIYEWNSEIISDKIIPSGDYRKYKG